jgi:hypothetical protein
MVALDSIDLSDPRDETYNLITIYLAHKVENSTTEALACTTDDVSIILAPSENSSCVSIIEYCNQSL